jgi:hypothetical protein
MLKKTLLFVSLVAMAGLVAGGCIINSNDEPCDGISCDGNGTCLDVGGDAECSCAAGYENDGPLHCVQAETAIDLDWAFGPGVRSCADAYVDTVNVVLLDGNTEVINSDVACSEGGVVISPVEDGVYTIELTGLSADSDAWYYASDTVDLLGSNVDLGMITLQPTSNGDMRFDWVFGEFEDDCVTAGIDRVRVKVYDAAGTLEFEADPVPYCDELGAVVTNFELGTWNLVLEGVCQSDISTGYELDANVIVAHPGENDYGTVILEDLGGGCP